MFKRTDYAVSAQKYNHEGNMTKGRARKTALRIQPEKRHRTVTDAPANILAKYYCGAGNREFAFWFREHLEVAVSSFNNLRHLQD